MRSSWASACFDRARRIAVLDRLGEGIDDDVARSGLGRLLVGRARISLVAAVVDTARYGASFGLPV